MSSGNLGAAFATTGAAFGAAAAILAMEWTIHRPVPAPRTWPCRSGLPQTCVRRSRPALAQVPPGDRPRQRCPAPATTDPHRQDRRPRQGRQNRPGRFWSAGIGEKSRDGLGPPERPPAKAFIPATGLPPSRRRCRRRYPPCRNRDRVGRCSGRHQTFPATFAPITTAPTLGSFPRCTGPEDGGWFLSNCANRLARISACSVCPAGSTGASITGPSGLPPSAMLRA